MDLIFILASGAGHIRFTVTCSSDTYVLLEATRASVMGSADPSNVTFPLGSIHIDSVAREISGHNPEQQDFIIGPNKGTEFRGLLRRSPRSTVHFCWCRTQLRCECERR